MKVSTRGRRGDVGAAPRADASPPVRASATQRALEQRANTAAAGLLGGETGLADAVGCAAPAAPFTVAGSSGRPLPGAVRARLEHGFGADLSAVRLHRDPAAGASLRALGSRGLAAGSDVFVDLRGPALGGEQALSLLAHEVAHVLQQTGRPGAGGRLRATRTHGAGAAQLADDDFVDRAADYDLFGGVSTWDEVKAAYADVVGVAAHVTALDAELGVYGPLSEAAIERLAAMVTTPAFAALDDALKGLYVDALKIVGGEVAFAAARDVLVVHRRVPTALRSRAFYEFVREASLGWLYGYATNDDFAKDYYPWRFVTAYRTFFASPGAEPIDLEATAGSGASQPFQDRLLDELKVTRHAAPGARTDNELRVAMLFALYHLDRTRQTFLPTQIANRREAGESLAETHAELARYYANGDGVDRAPSPLTEPRSLFASVFKPIRKHAAAAAAFWERVAGIESAFERGAARGERTAAEIEAIALGIRTEPRFARMPGLLDKTAGRLLARPGGNLLGASAFAARVEERRSAVAGEMARHAARLSELVRTGMDTGAEAIRIGLALRLLGGVEAELARYDGSRDEAFAARSLADERVAARLRLARVLMPIGDRFGWTTVRDAAREVFREGPQLALVTSWEQDPKPVEYGQLSSQIGGQLAGLQGTNISGSLLERFVYIDFYNQLASEITRLLGAGARGREPVLTQAVEAARASAALPRRFIVRDWAWGDPSEAGADANPAVSPAASGASAFASLVLNHQVTAAHVLSERAEHPDEAPLVPVHPPPAGSALFMWFVPTFDAFVRTIAAIGTVRDAVDANWAHTVGEDVAAPDPETAPFEWLGALQELVKVLNASVTEQDVKRPGDSAREVARRKKEEEDRRKALLEAIGGAISTQIDHAFEAAEDTAKARARQAVSHQRRMVIEQTLRPMFTTYDRFDNADWSVPGKIFDAIAGFARFVWPDEDTALHTAALALEIAPELMGAFGPHEGSLGSTLHERRFDIIDTVLGLSWGALNVWEAGRADPEAVAAGTASALNPVATISPLGESTLAGNAEILGALRDSLGARAEAELRRHGLRASKGADGTGKVSSVYWDDESNPLISGNTVKRGAGTLEVAAGHPFQIYGITYTLVDVLAPFTFHPGFGRGESLGVAWAGGDRPGGAKLLGEDGMPLARTGKPLLRFLRSSKNGDAEAVTVTDGDIGQLALFSKALSERFALDYIEGAGVLIEKTAGVILDVLEFVPGVGQGLAAARFAAGVLDTITSSEFKDLLEAFSEDGFGAIEGIFSRLEVIVQPEDLANALIFKQPFTSSVREDPALKGKDARQKAVARRGGPWTRIAVLLKNVVNVGRRVLDRFKQLSERVQTPVQGAQSWVLRTPAAGLLLDLVERGFDAIGSLSIEDLAQSAEDLVEKGWQTMITEAATDAAQGVADRGRDVLDTVRHLELPEELIPVEYVVDFVIDLVVHALSAKYRKGVEAVRGVLRTLGLWDTVVKAISDGLLAAGEDPNALYRKHVRAKLQPWLAAVRDDFAAELVGTLDTVPFLGTLNEPKGSPVALDFSGFGFPEAEGYRAADPAGQRAPFAATPSGGEPLSGRARMRAEAALGHDLGHVRVHRDGAAARATGRVGAEALASGSHVFLRPGLDPAGGAGRRILGHELGHVIQQTGPRPLGRDVSRTPVPGRPGAGLRLSPGREASADRAGEAVATGQLASRPVDLGGASTRAAGLQPAFSNRFVKKFLGRLHDPSDLLKAVEELRGGEGPKAGALDARTKAVADALGPALTTWVGKTSVYAKPFSTVHTELAAFVESVWDEFVGMIPAIVALSGTTMTPPRGSGQERGTVAYLPPAALEVQLSRTLYGLTSMAFVVELNTEKGPALVNGRDVVDERRPVKQVDMAYVHLPLLGESAEAEKLWDLLTTNTFKGTDDYGATTHDSFKGAMKLVLGRGSPDPGNYVKSAFKLGARRATTVRNQRGRMVDFVDRSKPWPTPAEYVDPDAGNVSGAKQPIGLRVGTFAEWGPGGAQSAEDRDAHHGVQYLLFEYIRNVKAGKLPFPHLAKVRYPWVRAAGGQVNAIVGSSKGIDVATYYPGRGGKMPTIYLARHTHQSGIHYRTERADDAPGGAKSQGAHIHNTFRRAMGSYRDVLEDQASLGALEARRAAGKLDEPVGTGSPALTVNAVGAAILGAARATYHDMWDAMRPKLEAALDGQEVAYYNAIARQRGMPPLDKGAMDKPFKAIKEDVEDVVGTTAGFR